MKTVSKEKIEKAKLLWSLIQKRKDIEKQESDLKDFFKSEITDGTVLEAGDVIILVEDKSRRSFDRKKLEVLLGSRVEEFETVTDYQQVTVKEKKAA